MSQTPGPTDDEFAPTGTRPASLWPSSLRAPDQASTGFAGTHFDPMAEERARMQTQAAAAFDVCRPALALRIGSGGRDSKTRACTVVVCERRR